MAKYKIGDLFINHKDSKILQVCEGSCYEDCCYNKVYSKKICYEGVSCFSLIGLKAYFKELPSLLPGTKVKVREDLKVGKIYGGYSFIYDMEQYKEVTIKDYFASCRCYKVYENEYNYSIEMFDQVINEPKTNNMETKEIKINVPEGYEIDKENSTFECIKLKPIKKELTYKDIAKGLFDGEPFYTDSYGEVLRLSGKYKKNEKNNATSKKQLERLLALNQLFNIAEYYNKKSPKKGKRVYCINLDERSHEYYFKDYISPTIIRGLIPTFNNEKDAKAVIDNPNFKEILDLIYKCDED